MLCYGFCCDIGVNIRASKSGDALSLQRNSKIHTQRKTNAYDTLYNLTGHNELFPFVGVIITYQNN